MGEVIDILRHWMDPAGELHLDAYKVEALLKYLTVLEMTEVRQKRATEDLVASLLSRYSIQSKGYE